LVIAISPAVYVFVQHTRTTTPAPPFTAAPEAQQAPWKIETYPAGAISKVGKAARTLAANRAAAVEGIVKGVYDAELMDPEALPKVLDRSFTQRAAESFAKSGLGVPKGASNVRSTTRRAKIGVDVLGGRAAAADVKISLVGDLKGETMKITQRATLWMQREQRHWRVVGYDVKQGPTPAHSSKAHKGHGGSVGK
jgi:hypothetical protein